jgi:hypothetical protein
MKPTVSLTAWEGEKAWWPHSWAITHTPAGEGGSDVSTKQLHVTAVLTDAMLPAVYSGWRPLANPFSC